MASTARVNQETREALLRARKAEIEEDPEKLEKILKETEQEQLGWELFYHGRMSLAEVIAELEPHLQPTDMDVAIEVLRDALARLPHTPGGLAVKNFISVFAPRSFSLRPANPLWQLSMSRIYLLGSLRRRRLWQAISYRRVSRSAAL